MLGQIRNQPRRDHRPHARGLELLHTGRSIFRPVIGKLRQPQAKQGIKLSDFSRGRLQRHQAYARGLSAGHQLGLAQRLQQIQPTHLDQRQRQIHRLTQAHAAGPGCHQRINRLACVQRFDLGLRLIKRCRNMTKTRPT